MSAGRITAAELDELAAATPDEVVTHAYTRDVLLPHDRTLALITLDNGSASRPNTFGPHGLKELREALDAIRRRAADGEVAALAVTGKPYVFAAGADLDAAGAATPRLAGLLAQAGHDVFGMMREARVPSFAFVNGVALGGGLELALHADYRTVDLTASGIGFPEVSLGLVPGWGGCWLLPNLIGIEPALRVIVENALSNKTLRGPEALSLGIADRGFGSARFLEDSIAWAAQILDGQAPPARPHRPGSLERAVSWDATVAVARRRLTRRIGTVPTAPYEALKLLRAARSGSREEGFAREEKVLSRLICSNQFAAGRYAFGLVRHAGRPPAGAPDAAARPITQVGIIGAGLMASQIASTMLYRLKVPVILSDTDRDRVAAGVDRTRAMLTRLHERGRLDDDLLHRLTTSVSGTVDVSAFAACDWVAEAVYEDLATKQQALGDVEAAIADTAILATNTSSLSVSAIGAGLSHPERLLGFHFFNPVSRMPLVEIIPGTATDASATATAVALAARLKKTAILTADSTGFAVNRVLARFLAEVTSALDSGMPLRQVDAALAPLGLPMAPSLLLELVGLPVAEHVLAAHHAAYGDRYPVSSNMERLARHGHLYLRDAAGHPTRLDKKALALLSGSGRPPADDQLLGRVQLALADEIHRMLDEQVVRSVEDVDRGLILGAGWPFHTGGITPYLDRVGASGRAFGGVFHPARDPARGFPPAQP